MLEDTHIHILPNITRYINPPNPIIEKIVEEPAPIKRPHIDLDSDQDNQPFDGADSLLNAYKPTQMIFMKWKDRDTGRNGVDYFASYFFQRLQRDKLVYQGHTIQDTLQFNSDIQSGNLLAVFKVGEGCYDLVLQNDSNSSGYTQWFNFTVSNRKKIGTVHFNIVNFYKKESLYRQGMKPLTKSLVHDKNWKRSCHKVEYYINEFKMEGRKRKYYKTLSFNYDFIFANDTVQFSSVYPYSYERLFNWVKDINSPKLRVKFLGATPLKKVVMMLHISSQNVDERLPKRAIVIMGRQHSGQTPSSFVIESIVEELLGFSQQNAFLLSKFDFYIFPMVNVDGVVMGNYRCNLAGYDLNRYWHLDECKSIPEVHYIKSQIKKIMKRTAIEMILDIHGHSSQMNSFFYGNNFGKYNMIFPYVASKTQPLIEFGSSSFSEEEGDKARTARVILGNMIKETGSVYTFQISLFGYTKNGKKIPFLVEHFQQMGRSLLSAMNKCEVEFYKQEKGLRESLFLKQIRKQLRRAELKVLSKEEACSDTEAKTTTLIQEKAKQNKAKNVRKSLIDDKNEIISKEKYLIDFGVQNEFVFKEAEYELVGIATNQPRMIRAKKLPPKISKRQDDKNLSVSIRKIEFSPENHKEFLLNKLQICGSTFSDNSNFQNKGNGLSPTIEKSAQTNFTVKMFKEKEYQVSPQANFVNNSTAFYGTSLRRVQVRDRFGFRERKSKSNKSGIDSADMNFEGILKFGKVIL